MPRRRNVSPLYEALERFGRNARQLSAARLESFPEVITVLFGETALEDPEERRRLAALTAATLERIIREISDPVDRRIAEAIFAAKPEFYEKNVTQRQDHVRQQRQGYVSGSDAVFTDDEYKERRPIILMDITAALEQRLSPGVLNPVQTLDPRTQSSMKQLYRYAQQTFLIVEAYDTCSRCEQSGVGDNDQELRIAPARRTIHSDEALWMFAQCMKYLRDMKTDSSAREYLREHVSMAWWELAFHLFGQRRSSRLWRTLDEDESDSPLTFEGMLSRSDDGGALAEEWLAVLTGHWMNRSDGRESGSISLSLERGLLLHDLLELCAALQPLFPQETVSTFEAEMQYHRVVSSLAVWGRADEGLPLHEQHRVGSSFVKGALSNPPKRYASCSKNEKVVWSDMTT